MNIIPLSLQELVTQENWDNHLLYQNDKTNGKQLDLRDADLRGADLRDAKLSDAKLRDADLNDANLRGASLTNTGIFHVGLFKHTIILKTSTEIQIGCISNTPEWWLENYKEIGEKENYSVVEIQHYFEMIKFTISQIPIYFKPSLI